MRQCLCGLLAVAGLAGELRAAPGAAPPRLFPDYAGVTLPPNIAPLNFKIQEPGTAYRVELRSAHGPPLSVTSQDAVVRIPPRAWARLLQANPGQPLYVEVAARTGAAGWTRFATVTNQIAPEEIDPWLAYRRLKPLFNYYAHLGIYQRNLESFEQKPILEKEDYTHGCLNCHTPLNRDPQTFAFSLRAAGDKNPLILVVSNQPVRVDRTMGYLAWHPSGRLLAFSANQLSFLFHTRGETREVYDAHSDLGIYRVDSNTVVFPPAIAAPNRNETWPAWSPEGRYLYFSSAEPRPLEQLSTLRYDLMRASFDLDSGQWGQPELMISAAETGLSVCQPKISPDGRWLLVTLCRNGSFPIFKADSDLYVMDLATRKFRRLEINSDQADTWHSWSSNSRWVVFSSKRLDGLLARPYFTYVDAQGQFHKPFVLPQEDPSFYGFCLDTFNVPELMRGPVTVSPRDLARTVVNPRKALTPQGPAQPAAAGSAPAPNQTGYP